MKQLIRGSDLSTGIQSMIVSFGIESEDKPIMEFEPANKLYQTTTYTGFRTFLRLKQAAQKVLYEPFAPGAGATRPR